MGEKVPAFENDDDDWPHVPPDPAITPQVFRQWRSPCHGSTNPERMNNPLWEWLIKAKISAYQATEQFNGPDPFDVGPGWCFRRFGQSKTKLSDGRLVLIGGEHEDYYDPDFYIYNDVVVQHPERTTGYLGLPSGGIPAD